MVARILSLHPKTYKKLFQLKKEAEQQELTALQSGFTLYC